MLAEVFGEGLTNKVTLYLPSTTSVDQVLAESTAKQFTERTLRFLSMLYGGATAQRALGAWVAADRTLVTEQVTLVYAFAPRLTREQLLLIKQYALDVKAELKQESVAVEINGALFFV